MDREKKIYVFADFLSFKNELIGTIYVSQTRGKEFYFFWNMSKGGLNRDIWY